MSRLIVKNIPKDIKETKIKEHFEKFGDVTDVKILFN
jgi:RNA recognition motif-containing protein